MVTWEVLILLLGLIANIVFGILNLTLKRPESILVRRGNDEER